MLRSRRAEPRSDGIRALTAKAPAQVRQRLIAAVVWVRSPELGLIGQGARYALAGATVAFVALATTITLAEGAGLAYEAAFAIGYSLALAAHFTLQRVFVWSHHEGFALPIHHQLFRYLPIALGNYGFVAAAIALLPHLLGVATLIVYLAATAVVTVVAFLLLRSRVFHADTPANGRG
jgi:putative flippase GtrA